MMKIIQIMGSYNDGGAEIFYIDALAALKNINIEQYAIVNYKNKKGISKLNELNIPFTAVSFNKLFKWSTKSTIAKVIKEFGTVDVLVNNAGITSDNLSIRLADENWKKVIDINLTSTFLMCKHSIKKMLKNKNGKIINITSIVAHTGNIGQANYAASKAGIIGFSKSLAIEYAKKGINVNCISPGFIKTEMTDKINEEFKKMLIEKIPSGDLGSGEDVANCAAFLSSNMSDYITGETIHVNGGMYMS